MKIIALFMAVYLSLGSFFPRTDFSQLLRLESAVDHFRQHRLESAAAGENFTLADFLRFHFLVPDGHNHPGDLPAHQHLPFQSLQHSTLFEPVKGSLFLDCPSCPGVENRIFHYFLQSSADFIPGIFHPPVAL